MRKWLEHSSIPFPIKMNWQTWKKTHGISFFRKPWRSLEPPFFCSVSKRLLAGALPAICSAERGARRTGKAVASRIGLPVAAAMAVAVIVIVVIIEGAERG